MGQIKLVSLACKNFLRNRKLFWMYSISTSATLLLLSLLLIPAATTGSADVYQLLFNMYLPIIIPVALITFSVAAFEFSREAFEEEKEFLFCARDYGQLKTISSTLVALLFLWTIFLLLIVITLFISARAATLLPVEIANVLSVAVLRIGGTTLVAILMGFFLGRIAKRSAAYSLIVVMTLLLSFAVGPIVSDILGFEASDMVRLVVYWTFLAPFELSTMSSIAMVDSIYLIPNELHQWLLPAIWSVPILAGIAVSLRRSKKLSVLAVMFAFGLMATPWAVYGSQIALPRYTAAPHSINDRSLMPEVFTSKWRQNPPDWDYLYPIPAVANYQIDLDIRSRLSGRVVMTLDEPFLRTPAFTLFRGYQINSITDLEGKQLNFSRDDNYITILTPDQENTMGFIFEYAGSGWGHYANSQGIFLPGSFPWYPWPGKQRFYWEETRFDVMVPPHFSRIGEVQGFDIKVNSAHSEVFTSHGITLTQSNEFISIPAQDLTLMAGQVQRVGDEDTLFFYGGIRSLRFFEESEFTDNPDVTDRNIRQQVREEAYALREMMGIEDSRVLNSTTFVMVPEFPAFSNHYITPIYLDGYILISEHPYVDLSLALAMQDIVRTCEKRDVYETLFFHLVQDEWVFSYLPFAEEMTELIDAKGEERVIQLVVEYLMDENITMSGRDFFQSLLEEH